MTFVVVAPSNPREFAFPEQCRQVGRAGSWVSCPIKVGKHFPCCLYIYVSHISNNVSIYQKSQCGFRVQAKKALSKRVPTLKSPVFKLYVC